MPVAWVIRAAKDPQAGIDPSDEGPVGSGFVAMNARPALDQPDGPRDVLERVGFGLAEYDVVRVTLCEHEPHIV
jgi:hypothetical protein